MINPRTLRIVLTVAAFFLPWLVALAALLGLPPEWADTIKKSLSIPEFYYTASLSFVVIVIFGVLIFILNEKIHDKVSELETLRKEHQARLAELDQKHADEISAAEHNHAAQTRQLIERADAQSKSLVERYEDEIRTLNAEHDLEVKTLIEEKNRAELRVAEEDAAHRYDIVTKIPNMQSWAVDVPNYCSLMVQKKYQVPDHHAGSRQIW